MILLHVEPRGYVKPFLIVWSQFAGLGGSIHINSDFKTTRERLSLHLERCISLL